MRITALNYQEQQLQLDDVLTRLLASAGAAPMNRTVKIHSMESKTTTPICFRFETYKCPSGDKCKYRHIKDPNFIPRDIKDNKDNTGAGKTNSHPRFHGRNLYRIITIIVLLAFLEENHLLDRHQLTQQCKSEH